MIQISSLINEFYVKFVYIVIINKISIQHTWIFVYIVINEFDLLCRNFYLLSHVPKIFFLSYSFVIFRIDFLLSIWVNLLIYIDIVMFGFWVEISTIIIIFILYMADKAFWRKIKVATYVFQPKER